MNVALFRSTRSRWFSLGLLALAVVGGGVMLGPAEEACGQDPGDTGGPIFGTAFDLEQSLYFWLNYTDGDSYGGANQHVRFGGTKYVLLDNGAWLFTGQGLVTDLGNGGASLGAVRRWLVSSYFLGDVVIGAGAHWDLTQSPYQNDYNQLVGNLELLTENWGLRLTGYAPVGQRVNTLGSSGAGGVSGVPFFQSYYLFAGGSRTRTDEVALGGVEVELAGSIGNLCGLAIDNDAAEVFVGYYNLQGAVGEQGHGVKGGLRGYLLSSVAANVTVANDNLFGTGVYGGFTWFFGGSGGNVPRGIEDKLTIPVYRNYQVATREVETTVGGGVVRLTQGGIPITFMHVNDSGATGDGTFENPHGTLADANFDPNKADRDITYVYSGTAFVDQGYAAAPNQRVLGEGAGNVHQVVTDQLGRINIPQVGGLGNPRPVLEVIEGSALTAANNSELSNFTIVNTDRAVRLSNLTGDVNVNRLSITGGSRGIDIEGGSGTFTFTDVTVTDPAFRAFEISGGSSTVNFGGPNDPVAGLYGPSVLTQATGGTALRIDGGHTGQFNQDPSSSIVATNGDGLQFDAADGQYNFTGPVTLNGGDAGIDILSDSAGTFTFANTHITNPTGPGLLIEGGTANVNFGSGSLITQNQNQSAVVVVGGADPLDPQHTGMLNFDGSLNATNGDGLQFTEANGIYTFSGPVVLNGGDAGIDILNLSEGTFNFSNTQITSPTGVALNVESNTAEVNFGAASSITQANNAAAVRFDGHGIVPGTGRVTFDGTITATNGTGLQFLDGGGDTYDFNGPVTLNGGDAGIDIINNSGTYTFANTDITNPAGSAVNIDGGRAKVTFGAGSSVSQANNAAAVIVQGGHGLDGSLTFDAGSTINATNGPGLQFDNADGEYAFNGAITLDGTPNSADTGIDIINDSAGTFTFSGTFADPIEITNDQGVAFNMDSSPGTATLNYFDIQQSVGAGIRANNSGTLNIFATDVDNTTGDGINVTNTNLDVNFVGIGVGVGIGDDGIEVVNNDGTDRTATIFNSNIFPLAGTGIANRGIFIDSSGTGSLVADVRFNQIATTNQTILTTSGPTARSLILDLQNSTLDTATPGVFTEEHVGGGLNSTIVRSWSSPNQVLGSVISGTAGGGILFDRITFDADGNPGNGFQQVPFAGTLVIGTVPPQTITRVTGDGLSLVNPTGDLSLQTLNVASFNGPGLNVDTSGAGSVFDLSIGGGTIDASGADAIVLNGVNNFSLNNTTVTNGGGFDTVDVTNSNVSGGGNTAATFNCTDGGGNSGSISFNGGANTCP